MTPEVVSILPTTMREAANLMRGRSIGSLVVGSQRHAVGIATISDLLDLLGRGARITVAPKVRRPLRHWAPHRKRHTTAGPMEADPPNGVAAIASAYS